MAAVGDAEEVPGYPLRRRPKLARASATFASAGVWKPLSKPTAAVQMVGPLLVARVCSLPLRVNLLVAVDLRRAQQRNKIRTRPSWYGAASLKARVTSPTAIRCSADGCDDDAEQREQHLDAAIRA